MLVDSLYPVMYYNVTFNSCFQALFMRRLLSSKAACGLPVYTSRHSCKLPTFIKLKKKAVQENDLLICQEKEKQCLSANTVVCLLGCDILGGQYHRAALIVRVMEWGPW